MDLSAVLSSCLNGFENNNCIMIALSILNLICLELPLLHVGGQGPVKLYLSLFSLPSTSMEKIKIVQFNPPSVNSESGTYLSRSESADFLSLVSMLSSCKRYSWTVAWFLSICKPRGNQKRKGQVLYTNIWKHQLHNSFSHSICSHTNENAADTRYCRTVTSNCSWIWFVGIRCSSTKYYVAQMTRPAVQFDSIT